MTKKMLIVVLFLLTAVIVLPSACHRAEVLERGIAQYIL